MEGTGTALSEKPFIEVQDQELTETTYSRTEQRSIANTGTDKTVGAAVDTVGRRGTKYSLLQDLPDIASPREKGTGIYFYEEFFSAELKSSRQLLISALSRLEDATRKLAEGRRRDADEAVMSFQELLPELFACRTVGDGFGAIVNAIMNAFRGLRGTPLTGAQISAVEAILMRLYDEPAITFDRALEAITEFEEADFTTTSEEMTALLEMIHLMEDDDSSQ